MSLSQAEVAGVKSKGVGSVIQPVYVLAHPKTV